MQMTLSPRGQHRDSANVASEAGSAVTSERSRRPRVNYSATEERYLMEGVAKYGTSWLTILTHYDFKPQRTAADLKEKFARIRRRKVFVFRSTCRACRVVT